MPESTRSTPPVSDEQFIKTFTRIGFTFCGGLVLVLALGVFFIVPNGSIHTRGMMIGVALGLVSWFASRWITNYAVSKAANTDPKNQTGAGAISPAVFMGIAFAESPALVGLAVATIDASDVGPLVISVPVAIAAIVFNASGPAALRRHLDRLRA
jgi:F0F1-type ATP synthase membrane subunit c/vacuolar-type H+-ATPase subunit K